MIKLVITRAVYPRIKNTDGSFELDQLIQQQDYIWNGTATLQTDCIANQLAMADMNFYNMKLLHKVVKGEVALEYFKLSTVQEFVKKYTLLFNNETWANKAKRLEGHSLSGAMLDIYDWCISERYSELESNNMLMDIMFPSFYKPEDEHRWVVMTYNNINGKLRYLKYVIKYNWPKFDITPQQSSLIIRDMDNERYDSLRMLFTRLTPKCYRKSMGCLNMWCTGLGMIIFSIPVKDDTRRVRNLGGWKDGLLDFSYNDSIFHYLTKYDVTVVAHGDELVHLDNDIIMQPTRNPFKANVPSYKSASKLIQSLVEYNIIGRINLLVCNANKQRLYPQIYRSRDYIVNMYAGNVIIG